MKIDLSLASNENATCWQRALAALQICLMMDLEEVNVFQRRGEEGFPTEYPCEHIADRPHINGAGIFLEGEHDLWGMVPSSGDIFGYEGVVSHVCTGTRFQ